MHRPESLPHCLNIPLLFPLLFLTLFVEWFRWCCDSENRQYMEYKLEILCRFNHHSTYSYSGIGAIERSLRERWIEFRSPIFKASTLEVVQFKNVIWVRLKSYAYHFQWKF